MKKKGFLENHTYFFLKNMLFFFNLVLLHLNNHNRQPFWWSNWVRATKKCSLSPKQRLIITYFNKKILNLMVFLKSIWSYSSLVATLLWICHIYFCVQSVSCKMENQNFVTNFESDTDQGSICFAFFLRWSATECAKNRY